MNLYNIIFTGSEQALEAARGLLNQAIESNGRDHKVAFPDTAYSLPCIYAATGKKMNCLGDLEGALEIVESLINKNSKDYKKLNLDKIRGAETREEILLKNPSLYVTPIVRNGKEATVGYDIETWKKWE